MNAILHRSKARRQNAKPIGKGHQHARLMTKAFDQLTNAAHQPWLAGRNARNLDQLDQLGQVGQLVDDADRACHGFNDRSS